MSLSSDGSDFDSFVLATQVERLVLDAGAERNGGVERALSSVRDITWTQGRTLLAKYSVLLATIQVLRTLILIDAFLIDFYPGKHSLFCR